MIAYFLQVSVYTLLFCSVYVLFLKQQPYAQLSRVFLWLTIVLPFLLPFLQFTWPEKTVHFSTLPLIHYLPEVTFQQDATAASGFSWVHLITVLYVFVALLLLFKNVVQWFSFSRQLSGAEKIFVAGKEIAIMPAYGPGSFGKYIFFPGNEIPAPILRHELAHVAQKHYLDLFALRLIRIFCWPHFLLVYLEKELRLVHEYAADRAAVAQDESGYAQLLLTETFGTNHPFIHTFFQHPLKQRLMMLQQQTTPNTGRSLRRKALISVALLSGLIVFAQCSSKQDTELGRSETTFSAIATPVANPDVAITDQKTLAQQTLDSYNQGVRENRIPPSESNIIPQQAAPDSQVVFKYVEQMPEFNGDVSAWLEANMLYPESAQKEQKSGRVVTKFVVSSTGEVQNAGIIKSSGVPALDEEAIRVIGTMPRWKPGMQSGKPVAVFFYLPIDFRLSN